MAVSSMAGYFPVHGSSSAETNDPADLTEFVLDSQSPGTQVSLKNPNPFCRLAAQTPLGSCTCDRGCGLQDVLQGEIHVCPFGMVMQRMPDLQDHPRHVSWKGRRFPSVGSMHRAFDEMIAAGFDEKQVLDHLPPNPILPLMDPPSGDLIEKDLNWQFTEPEGLGSSQHYGRLDHLLEFVTQVHNLIARCRSSGQICERFLKALSGILPFDEMSIYMADAKDCGYVLGSAVDNRSGKSDQPEEQPSSLDPGSLGSLALGKGESLVEISGRINVLDEPFSGCGDIAIPLMTAEHNVKGVWVARRHVEYTGGVLRQEWLTLMKLLGRLIADRFEIADTGPSTTDQPITTANTIEWNMRDLGRILEPEIARAERDKQKLGLLIISVLKNKKKKVEFPHAEYTMHISKMLRIYDLVGVLTYKSGCWAAVLPNTGEKQVRVVAARIVELLQDLLDAGGGMEERGLSVNAGTSIFGGDAASLEDLIKHAKVAASSAHRAPSDECMQIFSA